MDTADPPVECARYASPHGAIRIRERADGAREYWQGGTLHTLAYAGGESLFGHIHAIAHLAAHAQRILLLGGAGASLATMCARRGASVTVIDIEPQAPSIARAFFGLPDTVTWITADANALPPALSRFDAIVLDAFDGSGRTRAADGVAPILALMDRLAPDGVLLANLAGPDGPSPGAWPLACALAATGLSAALLRAGDGHEGNEILHLSRRPAAIPLERVHPASAPDLARPYLRSLEAFPAPG